MYMDISIPEDAFRLAPNLRQLDKYELALMGRDPLWSLLYPFRANRPNTHTFTVFNAKEIPIAMWGVCPMYKSITKGAAWWLSTDEPFKSWHYLRNQKRAFEWVASHYKFVFNFATAEQKQSLRWVQYMGFTVSDKEVLVKNVKMKYFYLEPKGFNGEPIDDVCGPRWRTLNQNSTDNS